MNSKIGERKYNLQIKDAVTKAREKMSALVLENEENSQIVDYKHHFENEYFGRLLWAGDLDGDGKLDLCLAYNSYEKGSFSSSSFLSSNAEKGKLVKESAHFFTAGC